MSGATILVYAILLKLLLIFVILSKLLLVLTNDTHNHRVTLTIAKLVV
jgi:hypothetical protein